jgi:hypothetical protein
VTRRELHELRYMNGGFPSGKGCAGAFLLIFISGIARPCAAECSERPTVMMSESTAETHLLARKYPDLPAHVGPLARIQEVTVLVTVDRKGAICEARALKGPRELRQAAVRTVQAHWRYRPFRVNWKPVVVQFPVTVKFVIPKGEPRRITGGENAAARAAV